jgi:hypothetical protein
MLKTVEPWQTWLAPQAFRNMLYDLGFTAVEVVDSNEAMERFGGRCDIMPSKLAIVTARK